MNSGQIFVLILVLIVMGFATLRRHIWAKGSQPRENPDYQRRIDALEHRVQTLERIVTDKGYDLKREFDKL